MVLQPLFLATPPLEEETMLGQEMQQEVGSGGGDSGQKPKTYYSRSMQAQLKEEAAAAGLTGEGLWEKWVVPVGKFECNGLDKSEDRSEFYDLFASFTEASKTAFATILGKNLPTSLVKKGEAADDEDQPSDEMLELAAAFKGQVKEWVIWTLSSQPSTGDKSGSFIQKYWLGVILKEGENKILKEAYSVSPSGKLSAFKAGYSESYQSQDGDQLSVGKLDETNFNLLFSKPLASGTPSFFCIEQAEESDVEEEDGDSEKSPKASKGKTKKGPAIYASFVRFNDPDKSTSAEGVTILKSNSSDFKSFIASGSSLQKKVSENTHSKDEILVILDLDGVGINASNPVELTAYLGKKNPEEVFGMAEEDFKTAFNGQKGKPSFLRPGAEEVVKFLATHQIPTVIASAHPQFQQTLAKVKGLEILSETKGFFLPSLKDKTMLNALKTQVDDFEKGRLSSGSSSVPIHHRYRALTPQDKVISVAVLNGDQFDSKNSGKIQYKSKAYSALVAPGVDLKKVKHVFFVDDSAENIQIFEKEAPWIFAPGTQVHLLDLSKINHGASAKEE